MPHLLYFVLVVLSCCNGDPDSVDFLPVSVKQYAGYATVNQTTNANLFYWFFESQTKPDDPTTPLAIWLNGGPGASSLFGLFAENGPVFLNERIEPEANPYSWNKQSHVLYIDQPVGAGYSFVDDKTGYMTNEQDLSRQFRTALSVFFTKHPEYKVHPLYITGESYAGKYIPYLATEILENSDFNLKGIAIGDGWMDPVIQHQAAIDFGFANALIDERQKAVAEQMYTECKQVLDAGDYVKANKVCGVGGGGDGQDGIMGYILNCAGGPDIYDIREFSGGLDPKNLTVYLNRKDIRDLLHVGDHPWVIADGTNIVAESLASDLQKPNTFLFAPLLEKYKIRVMLYTGNFDMSCGYIGTERILNSLQWTHQTEWRALDRAVWTDVLSNGTAGYVKRYDNLMQVVVPRAGHLVPMNRPRYSQVMITNFLLDQPFHGTPY